MSEQTHTPGPWKRNGLSVFALTDGGYNRFFARFEEGFIWTSKTGDMVPTPPNEVEANARLAAAAPELLTVSADMRNLLDYCLNNALIEDLEARQQFKKTANRASEIIAKALGKEGE